MLMNQGFHPRYAERGPYLGFGSGRYGGRGRPGDRSSTHHPGFAAQRDWSGVAERVPFIAGREVD
jgi:hypothetical protein